MKEGGIMVIDTYKERCTEMDTSIQKSVVIGNGTLHISAYFKFIFSTLIII